MFETLRSRTEREEQTQRVKDAEAQLEADRKANGERNTAAGKADAKLIGAHALEIREGEIVGLGRQLEGRIITETATVADLERERDQWRKVIETRISENERDIIAGRSISAQLEAAQRNAALRELLRLAKLHGDDRTEEVKRHRDSLRRDQAELVKTEKELASVQREIQKLAVAA